MVEINEACKQIAVIASAGAVTIAGLLTENGEIAGVALGILGTFALKNGVKSSSAKKVSS